MITTLTPNPSIDRTLHIAALERGAFIRATSSTAEAGGKGINVARCLAVQGLPSLAVVPASPASSAVLRDLLGAKPPLVTVAIGGELRTNVSVVEADGTVTKLNEPGPRLGLADETATLDAVAGQVAPGDWLAACGSLPPGFDPGFYARLGESLPDGVLLAVDADGPPLAACLGVADLIKPNHEELERLVGRELPTLGDVLDAACSLPDRGVGTVLVSLGADGALLVEGANARHGEARGVVVRNNVGAGDALLAGCLAVLAGLVSAHDPLAEGIAWSVAACESPGTTMRAVSDEDRARVVIHEVVDRMRRLRP